MRVLLATGQLFTPQMYGGAQASGNQLATLLKTRGHESAVLSALSGAGYTALRARILMKLLRRKTAMDTDLGYPVYRGWFPWEGMAEVTASFKPDVVVVLARDPVRMALAAQKTGTPVVMMLQDVEFSQHGGEFSELGMIPCVANSEFTANTYREAYGVAPVVIHPMIDAAKYKTTTTRENVTFINPHPKKGLEVALAVAKLCPNIPFSFVESWPLTPEERVSLENRLARLPNVTLSPPTKDMKTVYGKAKIVLAPSQWAEGYGRIASEPQFSGIPVIASAIGGLPEAVGPGGILLSPDAPTEDWAAAVNRLWTDAEYYNALSIEVLHHASRPAINCQTQMDLWEQSLLKVIGS